MTVKEVTQCRLQRNSIGNIQNITTITNNNNNNVDNNNNNNVDNNNNNETASNVQDISGSTHRRMTRSSATHNKQRTTSAFDIPILSNLTNLFENIDKCRREKYELSRIKSNNNNNNNNSTTNEPTLSIEFEKHNQFQLMSNQINELFQQTKMRTWTCLLPTIRYPLPTEYLARSDPYSLANRTYFSPAEDDLLLRGVITIGEDWGKIRMELLPSKDEQLLSFRFSQLTSNLAADDSKFKR